MEVNRRGMQAKQEGCLLDARRLAAEVVEREVTEAELALRRRLPQEVQVDEVRLGLRRLEQSCGRDVVEVQQRVRSLELRALAAGQFYLMRRLRRRQDDARPEYSVFLEQQVHGRLSSA